jgi:hypothetical protein
MENSKSVKSVKSLSTVALAKADAVQFLCLRLVALRSLPDLPVSQAADVAVQSHPNIAPAFVPSPAFPPF